MSSTNMGEMLDVAERYQRAFVQPLIDAVTTRLDAHFEALNQRVTTVEHTTERVVNDVAALKGNEKKALLGWGIYATAFAACGTWIWNYFKSHIRIG